MTKVRYDQKGYVGSSMSVRALEAYDNGEMPISKWSKKAIIEEFCEKAEEENIPQEVIEKTVANMKTYAVRELRNDSLRNEGWHHMSKYLNKTEFYSVDVDYCLKEFSLSKNEKENAASKKWGERLHHIISDIERNGRTAMTEINQYGIFIGWEGIRDGEMGFFCHEDNFSGFFPQYLNDADRVIFESLPKSKY